MSGKNRRSVLLGEAIRRARKASGISQEKLAFEAQIDRTYVSQLENGHKSPTVDVLFRIGPVLGVTASELIHQVERSLQSRKR
jgi:transcriptional regulator with XRE-family HTH domain